MSVPGRNGQCATGENRGPAEPSCRRPYRTDVLAIPGNRAAPLRWRGTRERFRRVLSPAPPGTPIAQHEDGNAECRQLGWRPLAYDHGDEESSRGGPATPAPAA